MKREIIKPGRGIRGPESAGCFNTGCAPMIRRNKETKEYIVGNEIAATECSKSLLYGIRYGVFNNLADHIGGKWSSKTTYKYLSGTAKVFKTATAAWKAFDAMCDEKMKRNRELAAKAKAARNDLNSSDPVKAMGAAFTLYDLGCI